MKKSLIIFTALLAACSNNSETTTSTDVRTDTTKTVVTEEVAETSIYEKDWRNFKIAIDDKDGPAVASFMDLGEESYFQMAEDVLMLFEDEVYAQKLADTNYGDLTDTEWESRKVKEFRAEQSSMDDEGNTYESAIFLYFEEQERGLKLINILMAG